MAKSSRHTNCSSARTALWSESPARHAAKDDGSPSCCPVKWTRCFLWLHIVERRRRGAPAPPRPPRPPAAPRPNRATALELLDRALLAGKRLDDVDLLQKGFALAWSVALPLLESLPPDERGGGGSARTPHASALANAEAYHHAALPPTDPHAARARPTTTTVRWALPRARAPNARGGFDDLAAEKTKFGLLRRRAMLGGGGGGGAGAGGAADSASSSRNGTPRGGGGGGGGGGGYGVFGGGLSGGGGFGLSSRSGGGGADAAGGTRRENVFYEEQLRLVFFHAFLWGFGIIGQAAQARFCEVTSRDSPPEGGITPEDHPASHREAPRTNGPRPTTRLSSFSPTNEGASTRLT